MSFIKLKKSTVFSIIAVTAGIILLSLTIGKELLIGKQPTLTSFITLHFAGYLFFLLMPVEGLVPYYLSLQYNPALIFFLSVATALAAQIIDFSIGYFIHPNIKKNVINNGKYKKYKKKLEKYGYWVILLSDLLFLSSPILIFIAGILRFRLRKILLYSSIGLSLKYLFLVILFSAIL